MDDNRHAKRRKLQAEARNLERRFELTFNYAAIGIIQTTLDRRVLLANKRFLELTGYSLEELQHQPTANIMVPMTPTLTPISNSNWLRESSTPTSRKIATLVNTAV